MSPSCPARATRWQLDVRCVVGDYLAIRLLDATSREELATTDILRDGAAHHNDLQLPAGDYLIELQSSTASFGSASVAMSVAGSLVST